MIEDSQTSRPPSPTDTLRKAAALMRERAEGAVGAAERRKFGGTLVLRSDGMIMVEEVVHAFAFTPLVALNVSEWLDIVAEKQEAAERVASQTPVAYLDRALAIARAYLGESA